MTGQYAVIFTSKRTPIEHGYAEMAVEIADLASRQPGFIKMDSARQDVGITVSYWESLEAIKEFKRISKHIEAQRAGKTQWYQWYDVKVCQVLREYSFDSEPLVA